MSLRLLPLFVGLSVVLANPFSGPRLGADNLQPGLQIEEFEPRSMPAGSTLFTTLRPEETGIDMVNEYEDPRMWTDRYQEYALGAIGTGITVADYDADGWPDLFVVNKTGKSKLYRNLGGWKFEDVTDSAGLGSEEKGWFDSLFGSDEEESVEIWKQGAAFADVNNDGWVDLYICRFNAPNQLYLNNGDGSFIRAENDGGLGIVSASGMASFCDLDRDGWLDVFVQTNMLDSIASPKGSLDLLYRNNGDGTFSKVEGIEALQAPTLGHSATCWDYNGDGLTDLYLANDFERPDVLLLNQSEPGAIKFTNVIDSVVPRQPFSSMGADIGDIDNDGRLDLLVADMAPTSHEMDQRGMGVTRYAMRSEVTDRSVAPQYMFNTLYLNSGVSRMREVAWLTGLARTDWTWSVRFEDLDCDGFVDLHITNGMVREYQNDDLRQKILRAEYPTARMRIMKSSPVMNESNLAFRNKGDFEFERVEETWGLGQVGVSFGAGFGDFDGDGDLDLVYSNFSDVPTVLRNDCETGNRVVFELQGTASNRSGVGATVTVETARGLQTRTLALSRGYLSTSEPVLHFGLGKEELMNRVTVEWPSGRRQVFQDLPSGRRYLVREPEANDSDSSPASPTTPPRFRSSQLVLNPAEVDPSMRLRSLPEQPLAPFRFDNGLGELVVDDFDEDGKRDVVVGGNGAALLLEATGGAGFGSSKRLMESGSDGPMRSGDFNGDGNLDLFVAGRGASTIIQGSGDGLSEEKTPVSQAASTLLSASVGDFDGDGVADLFLGAGPRPGAYPLSNTSQLLRGGASGLSDVSRLLPNEGGLGIVAASEWADYDKDGWLDLVIAEQWGPIRLLRNLNGEGFEETTQALGADRAGSGLWHSIGVGDFNGDGAPDVALGNVGLNTPYRASRELPAILYFGKFGGQGPGQIVEGHWESGQLFPLRARKELGQAISAVLRKYPSNNEFAAATITEIFGEEKLANAKRIEATELRSGVLLSQADGSYAFRAFPRIAQVGTIRDFAIADFDGDGNLDLAVTHNLYSLDPVIGRFDGGFGQLLLGDGSGSFTAADPEESGLVIPGEGGSIAPVDWDGDGDLDLLSARTGEPPLAFENLSEAE